MSNELTVEQQAAFLCSDVLNYMCIHECTGKKGEGKFLAYEMVQVSDSPFTVKIINLGEKTNLDVLSITFETGKLVVRSLMGDKDAKGKKLPNNYIHTWNGIQIGTHLDAVVRIALPQFIRNAIEALNNNLVSPQWLFISILLRRLNIEYGEMMNKATVLEFNGSDVAWTFAECVRLSQTHNLPDKVQKMFKAKFNAIPEDVRKPFETITIQSEKVDTAKKVEQLADKK